MITSIDIGEKNFAYCIGTTSKVIRWVKKDIKQSKRQTIVDSCILISEFLKEDKSLFGQCDAIVIEQQMCANVRAFRLGQHVWTWFYTSFPTIPVTFFPSHAKTQHYLGKNSLSAKARKTWAVEKTLEILTERNDIASIAILDQYEKKDDLADTFLQMMVYYSKLYDSQPSTSKGCGCVCSSKDLSV